MRGNVPLQGDIIPTDSNDFWTRLELNSFGIQIIARAKAAIPFHFKPPSSAAFWLRTGMNFIPLRASALECVCVPMLVYVSFLCVCKGLHVGAFVSVPPMPLYPFAQIYVSRETHPRPTRGLKLQIHKIYFEVSLIEI